MNKLFVMLLASVLAGPALAAPKAKADNPEASGRKTSEKEKSAACERHAQDMKGDDRKTFMRRCMSMDAASSTDRDKSRACNNEAKGMKGDERRAFLDKCMQGVSNATAASGTVNDKSRPALQSPKP